MSLHRMLLACIVSAMAFMVLAPATNMQASRNASPDRSDSRLGTAANRYAATGVAWGAETAQTDTAKPIRTTQGQVLDWFPFNNCFTFSSFCNTSFFGGCFIFNVCRPMTFTGCFNFFSFGCRTLSSSFFPFFNRFNFNFNFANTVNCVQIMRMPGGGTITIRTC